jgi:hypothetical protein
MVVLQVAERERQEIRRELAGARVPVLLSVSPASRPVTLCMQLSWAMYMQHNGKVNIFQTHIGGAAPVGGPLSTTGSRTALLKSWASCEPAGLAIDKGIPLGHPGKTVYDTDASLVWLLALSIRLSQHNSHVTLSPGHMLETPRCRPGLSFPYHILASGRHHPMGTQFA